MILACLTIDISFLPNFPILLRTLGWLAFGKYAKFLAFIWLLYWSDHVYVNYGSISKVHKSFGNIIQLETKPVWSVLIGWPGDRSTNQRPGFQLICTHDPALRHHEMVLLNSLQNIGITLSRQVVQLCEYGAADTNSARNWKTSDQKLIRIASNVIWLCFTVVLLSNIQFQNCSHFGRYLSSFVDPTISLPFKI